MLACPECGKDNPTDAAFCNACGTSLLPSPTPGETRKIVTVVFCDLAGSTELGERIDPEALRRLMTRYYDTMKRAVESHGGTVEKYIGDAVMAVFGVPRIHEDDALRAVRAAVAMRSGLDELNEELEKGFGLTLQIHVGVNTGEVVVGDRDGQGEAIVLGDMVNVAARLEQAAAPGEIVLGAATQGLVRDAVVVEPVGPLTVKGKPDGLIAYRLREVVPGAAGHARRMDSPMVGRQRQLRQLQDAFEDTVQDRACNLFTVFGPAGIGKTRLIREFLTNVEEPGLVLSGRCLPYGEGITFWAVSEMVVSAAGVDDADTPERAAELIERLVGDAVDAGRVGEQLASLVGIAQLPAETEPAWAVRRLFEILASRGPLVAFFDDLHWAEPGLLDVIEHVAELAREAPILLLCTARPELLETRPGWGGGMLHATAIQLEPLDDLESEELIANLLSHPALTPEIRQRIREAARGNPLFVEEMLSMLLDDGSIVQRNGGWEATVDLSAIQVPPAISTLLAARLDRLSTEERSILEAASVVGEIFERDAVRALIGGSIEESLTGLIRKDLIVPGRSDLGAGDALRFRHVLIRDAAYAGMAKERRAAQHGAFGDWLAATVPERLAEYDEVLGYHYEQAYELLRELGVHEGVQAHADRASFHLARAGFRAQARDDAAATANLLFRAARLRPLDAQRVEMLIGSINAATEMLDTRTLTDASALAVADASELEDEALRLRVELAVGWARISNEREFFIDALRAVEAKAWEAVAILEPLDDRRGLAEAWRVLAWERGGRSQFAEGVEAARVAYQHAQASGDETAQIEALTMELGWMKWGPTSVTETARRCDELWERADRSRTLAAEILLTRAANEAMSGHVDAAEQAFSEGVATLEDLGRTLSVAFAAQTGWIVAVLAGDPAAAEARMAASIDLLIRHGRHSLQHLHQLMRAQAMCALGRIQEAEAIVREQRGQVSEDDLTLVPIVYRVLAQAASDRGDHEEADRASRKALEIGHMTDGVFDLAWTYLERGDILRAAADPSAADAAYREALQLAEGKGDVATAAYARARAG